jgi:hypothetical protein
MLLTGCSEEDSKAAAKPLMTKRTTPLRSHLGDRCIVQFRRDALGAAGDRLIPPQISSINDAETSFSGVLTDVAADSVVITQNGPPDRDLWIPMHAVLSIQFEVADAKPSTSHAQH